MYLEYGFDLKKLTNVDYKNDPNLVLVMCQHATGFSTAVAGYFRHNPIKPFEVKYVKLGTVIPISLTHEEVEVLYDNIQTWKIPYILTKFPTSALNNLNLLNPLWKSIIFSVPIRSTDAIQTIKKMLKDYVSEHGE